MWRCIKAGLVRSGRFFFSQRLQGFFATTLVCVFYGVPTKKGAPWCLFLLYQPTSMNKRQIAHLCLNVQRRFLLNTLKISLKMLPFLRVFPLCVAGLQQMPPIPHYYQAGQATERIRSSATFNMNLSTHLCFAFIQVGLIDPQTKCVIIRWMLARNDLTGVFLDRHGWFDRPLWQSLRCFGLTYMVTCIVCIQCFH